MRRGMLLVILMGLPVLAVPVTHMELPVVGVDLEVVHLHQVALMGLQMGAVDLVKVDQEGEVLLQQVVPMELQVVDHLEEVEVHQGEEEEVVEM